LPNFFDIFDLFPDEVVVSIVILSDKMNFLANKMNFLADKMNFLVDKMNFLVDNPFV
jgi:hypothetical protein